MEVSVIRFLVRPCRAAGSGCGFLELGSKMGQHIVFQVSRFLSRQ